MMLKTLSRQDSVILLSEKRISLLLGNLWSIRNKYNEVMLVFTDEESDMALWTETWLTPGYKDIIAEFKRANYQFSNVDRKEKSGGGIALMTKSNYKIELKHHEQSITMEHAMWKITEEQGEYICIIGIYRPPLNTVLHIVPQNLFDEFATLMEGYLGKYRPLLVMGDF